MKTPLHSFLILILVSFSAKAANIQFSFSLSQTKVTSAGVFSDDGKLLRTLWSGVEYNAGKHYAYWNGTDDAGNLLPNGNYKIRVLSNNVKCEWEGVIGNTSNAKSGPTVLHSFQTMYGMAFTQKNVYYTTNYVEQRSAINKLSVSHMQSKTSLLNAGAVSKFVATDGHYVYWDAQDAHHLSVNFVYATRVSDDSEVTNFNAGKFMKVTYVRSYANAIDIGDTSLSKISGMAVQKNGKYLFISHYGINELHVINKLTGELIQNISIDKPSSVCVDNEANIWLISDKKIEKLNVNQNGSLSNPVIEIKTLIDPLAIAVSPNGTTLIVADGGTSQQLKAFNAKDGTGAWVLGNAGGYANYPAVDNEKFFFSDFDGARAFIAFAPDGSFWVLDAGNDRVQHFSESRKFIDRIMYLPHFYSCVVDPNNTKRVFADYLEFNIDYSKKLAPDNGSWTLVKNWMQGINKDYDNQFMRFRSLTTLSNGHTYALLPHLKKIAVIELPSSGNIRYTGIEFANTNVFIDPDGSLRASATFNKNQNPFYWLIYHLNGFDNLNNPLWSAPDTLATVSANENDPVYRGNSTTLHSSFITSSNILLSFDGGIPPHGSNEYHLGGIELNNKHEWLWRTASNTVKNYSGTFPSNGDYDIGNNVAYAGSVAMAIEKNIVWGYHGEFWKNSEVNKWNIVHDDGLFVGQFGVTGVDTIEDAPPMMAGNSFSASLVKAADGNIYLYHNDESYHSGIHRWKITGLEDIAEESIPVVLMQKIHGLTTEYFKGIDLNNLNLISTENASAINLTQKPAVIKTNNYSIRYTGFIHAPSSQNYTFFINANSGVRLLVGNKLLIDEWKNISLKEFTTQVSLTSEKNYSIRLEYFARNATVLRLSWSSATALAKQIISPDYFFPADRSDTTNGYDLLSSLPFNTVMPDSLYGWTRFPVAENLTNSYQNYWSVETNHASYKPLLSPDLWVHFTQNADTAFIKRDLGTNTNLFSWNLTGRLDFDRNAFNFPNNTGGQYFDVLDEEQKIIARFYMAVDFKTRTITIFGNNAVIAKGAQKDITKIAFASQPLSIKAIEGSISFQYKDYSPVTSAIFDPSANWKNPKTLRIYFFGKGANYSRIIDIETMHFSYKKK